MTLDYPPALFLICQLPFIEYAKVVLGIFLYYFTLFVFAKVTQFLRHFQISRDSALFKCDK